MTRSSTVRYRHPRQRLRDYDYSTPGAYFISTRIAYKCPRLGSLVDGRMALNALGEAVESTWHALPNHHLGLRLDEWQVMPDHIHGILWLGIEEAGHRPAATTRTEAISPVRRNAFDLTEVMRALKSFSARKINGTRNVSGSAVWQRGFHERVIRSESELTAARLYIQQNPMMQWIKDEQSR